MSHPEQTAFSHPIGTEWHQSLIGRRTFLTGIAGVVGLNIVGCSSPPKPPTGLKSIPHTSAKQRLSQESLAGQNSFFVGPDTAHVTEHNLDNPKPYNGLLNSAQMARDGIAYNLMRVGKANEAIDGYLERSRKDNYDAGILPGLYSIALSSRAVSIDKQASTLTERIVDTDPTQNADPRKVEGLLVLDVETISHGVTSIDPSFQDVIDLTAAIRKNFGEHRPIIVYTGSFYWGDNSGRKGTLGNPGTVSNTNLWIASWLRDNQNTNRRLHQDKYGNLIGPIEELIPKVSRPGTSGDPYRNHRLKGYNDYAIRQFTATALYQQLQNQSINATYGSTDKRATIDFNISFSAWSRLCKLANVPDGKYPEPRPFHISQTV